MDLYRAEDFSDKPKWYNLVEFPYPSGAGLHVGHVRSYTALDVVSRKLRMQGFNVLYPIGWDAFGLPTENYAIKHKIHPRIATEENIATFKRQLKSLGLSYDWSREIDTTDPEYYKWTQWIFLKFYEHGLAYKKKMPINWCLSCKVGLANEEVVEGRCERCGGPTEKREKEQWMLAITKYADRLISDLDTVDYLEKIKTQQINWIGRSEGINFTEKVKDLNIEFEVYDSIPQTFLAQTFTIIAPEHPLVKKLVEGTEYEKPVMEFVEEIKRKKAIKKFDIEKDLEGIFTGRYVENPFGTGDLPIWIASYVLADYGTGIVNCSAHDERDFAFAKKYNIPLKIVLLPEDKKQAKKVKKLDEFYREPDGLIQQPEEFKGMRWDKSREPLINYIEKKGFGKKAVNYKLRDWIFSRQHYWGEPIPIVFCEKCGTVPVPEKDLPVKLPDVENYEPTDTGESPLAKITDWVNTTCPVCGGPARRETDTMPNWAGSSWYFLRYADPKNDKAFADAEKLKYWMPVNLYNGGMEHTTLHLLYSRFWNKFLYDIGVVPTSEPYARRVSHGMVLAEDGKKMSKSLGNVINPDEVVDELGADTLRMYEMFMGPFGEAIPWSAEGTRGVKRFLDRVWKLRNRVENQESRIKNKILDSLVHKTIKKVTDDIDGFKFNTAVSALMILLNAFEKEEKISAHDYKILLLLLSPLAPHIAEELWSHLAPDPSPSQEKGGVSIFQQLWPQFNPELIKEEKINLVIQVNGKIRDTVEIEVGLVEDEVKKTALENEKVKKWIEGKEIVKVIFVKDKLVNIVIK